MTRISEIVLQYLGCKGGEVEEPVPEAADDEGGHDVPDEDVGHPTQGKLFTRSKGRVLHPELAGKIIDAEIGECPRPGSSRHGSQVPRQIQVRSRLGLLRLVLLVLGDGRGDVAQGPGGGHVPGLT